MSLFDPYEAMDRLNAEFTLSAISVDGWDGVVADDVLYLTASIPLPAVNIVAGARFSDENADHRIDALIAWFDERRMPMSWWISPRDAPADLAARLMARSFADEEVVPGMIADLAELADEAVPDGVHIQRVVDASTYRLACATMAEGFGAPRELGTVFEAFASLELDDDAMARTYLASIDGRPVATSLGFMLDDVLGIFNVSTVESARRRGIGRAVTLAALRDGAARGARTAVLQSSTLGHSVYESLGFRDYGTYRLLVRPASA